MTTLTDKFNGKIDEAIALQERRIEESTRILASLIQIRQTETVSNMSEEQPLTTDQKRLGCIAAVTRYTEDKAFCFVGNKWIEQCEGCMYL